MSSRKDETRNGPPAHKISPDVLTAHLDDEAVLLDLKTKRYYRLNETGAAIWKCLERALSPSEIVASLTEEFAVDSETAGAELDRVIADLKLKGLLE